MAENTENRITCIGDRLRCGFCYGEINVDEAMKHFRDECKGNAQTYMATLKVIGFERFQTIDSKSCKPLKHGYECGHCESTKRVTFVQLVNHFAKCAQAKEKIKEAKQEREIYELLDSGSKAVKKRPASPKKRAAVKTERKRPAGPQKKKKPNPSVALPVARTLPGIPENKQSKKSLMFLMTFPGRTCEGAEPADLLRTFTEDLVASVVGSAARTSHDCDSARLLATEVCEKVQAYTISAAEHVDSDRHLTLNLSSSKFCDEVFQRFGKVNFDQICFDWSNSPGPYLSSKLSPRSIFKLLKNLATSHHQVLNVAGGVIYLPFKLEFYAVVVGYKADLGYYYDISYVDETVLAQECHLYKGTESLDETVKTILKLGPIKATCLTKQSIHGNGDISSAIPILDVQDHFGELQKKLDVNLVRMIRLAFRPQTSR